MGKTITSSLVSPPLSYFYGNRVIFGKCQYNHLITSSLSIAPYTFPFRKSGPCPPVFTTSRPQPSAVPTWHLVSYSSFIPLLLSRNLGTDSQIQAPENLCEFPTHFP